MKTWQIFLAVFLVSLVVRHIVAGRIRRRVAEEVGAWCAAAGQTLQKVDMGTEVRGRHRVWFTARDEDGAFHEGRGHVTLSGFLRRARVDLTWDRNPPDSRLAEVFD